MDKAKLTPKQERFAKLYSSDQEFFGNGVKTYIEVYKPDQSKKTWYKTACVTTSQILSNLKVCQRINELLEADGLNDQFVDKQLLHLITQHEDKSVKLQALKEYNQMKNRITKHLDVTSKGVSLISLFDAKTEGD